MLQNRVDPFGSIIITRARGSWMGNRGVIHNHRQEITHAFKHKAWIICALEFKERHRVVMAPNRWTELFFLDEATAFAAGHRPCFECRREEATRFKSFWLKGNPRHKFTMSTSINEIDAIIHRERIDAKKKKVTHERFSSSIPEGTFVVLNGEPFLLSSGKLHHWTPFGYESQIQLPKNTNLTVLTPSSIVNAFNAGYIPQLSLPAF